MCPLLIVCRAIYLPGYLGIYPSPHSFLTYLLWWICSLRAAAPRMEKPVTTPHPRSPSSKSKADQTPDIYPWDREKQVGCFLPVLSPYALHDFSNWHISFIYSCMVSCAEIAHYILSLGGLWAQLAQIPHGELWEEQGTCVRRVAKIWLTAASLSFAESGIIIRIIQKRQPGNRLTSLGQDRAALIYAYPMPAELLRHNRY